jgi:hypothetical protein
MYPQGRFHSVTRISKLVNTQSLIGFPTPTIIQVHQLSSTQPAQPKRMYPHPSLPHSPSGNPSPFRDLVHLVQNLHVGTLRTHIYEKSWTNTTHLGHAGLDSWPYYTNNLYIQKNHGCSSIVHLPFPIQT